ncbi:MAG TPA: hypothetical protein VJH75_00660 [Patescibacteria group bacterium]|nr:hypothetical protein [Patescibacteria group bacterium]
MAVGYDRPKSQEDFENLSIVQKAEYNNARKDPEFARALSERDRQVTQAIKKRLTEEGWVSPENFDAIAHKRGWVKLSEVEQNIADAKNLADVRNKLAQI